MRSDYRAEIERRIGQFRRHLKPMDHRAHEEAHGSCFLNFENHPIPMRTRGERRREEREPAPAAVAEAFGESGGTALGEPRPPDLPEEG